MTTPPDEDRQSPQQPNPSPARQPWDTPPPPAPARVNPPGPTPYVTYGLIAVTTVVFLLQMLTQASGVDIPAALGEKINEYIIAGQYWRLFTPMLLHGSILHIGFNMYALYVFGPGLERFYRPARFLLLYLLAGFAGNVFSFLFTAAPSLGASTAIFGLLGAQGVFIYRNREMFGSRAGQALRSIIGIAAINLLIGLVTPGIDYWGHLGGLLGGSLFAWLAGPLLQVEPGYPPHVSDARRSVEVATAAVAVGVIFAILAAWKIFA